MIPKCREQIKIMEATPSTSFSAINVNKIIIHNKFVEVDFRGFLNADIANNTAIISNLPSPIIGSLATYAIHVGGQYSIQSAKWGYITNSELRGERLPANTWVHIHIVYIMN